MVNVDEAVIARLKIGKDIFEILVDCDLAMEFRKGKSIGLDKILATDEVYKDVKKGQHASEHELKKIFGTDDPREVAIKIIKEGELQLTTTYKNKLRDEKKKQIIDLIHRNAIDAKTGNPHPSERIENAMDEARVNIDELKPAEDQIQAILKEISAIIPIKFESRRIEIIIPAQYAGGSFHILKQYGKVFKEEWQNNGALKVVIEIPAGLQEEFFSKLNNMTHGEIETKVLNE
ncbi:ribosome assembly factor SBDS [archaeon]|nr:ribosome assembly factor SBDS [archaeon]|tara:strand:+ start:984 stop:1682 length:699 start_codon:yes stop_codon:yes gene_type:complete